MAKKFIITADIVVEAESNEQALSEFHSRLTSELRNSIQFENSTEVVMTDKGYVSPDKLKKFGATPV